MEAKIVITIEDAGEGTVIMLVDLVKGSPLDKLTPAMDFAFKLIKVAETLSGTKGTFIKK